MNRWRGLLALLVVAALPLPLVGCGVPNSGPPIVVKDALGDRGSTGSNKPISKKTPAGATDALDLVGRYLKASAWANEVGPEPEMIDKAADPVKEFMTTAAQTNWQRGQEITVVRTRFAPLTPTANGTRVDAVIQPLGVLNSRGTIEPKANMTPTIYPFMVVPAERGSGLRISNPPAGMLLSVEGIDELYDVQPIYFWDTANRNLVPDLRYISKSVSPANRLFQVANWLLGGPSDFLKPTVNPVPAGIELKDRPVLDGASGTVRINLSAKAASVQVQLPKLTVQLKWSLRPQGGLELQIEGQRQDLGRDAGLDNPAATPDDQKDPPRFAVVDGRVRHIGGDSTAVPALASDDNSGVVSAAILRNSGQPVALVREEGGRVRLWLGSYDQGKRAGRYTPVDLLAETMSRPAGLTTPALNDPAFLVAADGGLYAVSVASKQVVDRTPAGIVGVTAVSVARDGRRVALVAAGRVYVGVVVFDGSSPSLTQLEEVHTGLSDAAGVAWSREEWLVVAGRLAGQWSLVEMTIDSALVEQMSLRNLSGLAVTRVVADPFVRRDDPGRGERGPIMIEANGHAYRVFSESVDEWATDGSPTPLPSGTSAKQSLPSAPFFLD